MVGEHFRETGKGPFFDGLVYARAVPKTHFLHQRRELPDCGRPSRKTGSCSIKWWRL